MKLEALALTFLLNSLWQVPVVILAASLGERLLRRGPARLRHALWLAALASCVLLPAASLIPEAAPPATEIQFEAPATVVDPPPAPAFQAPELPPVIPNVVAILYGLFLAAGAFRLGRSWWKARMLARTASAATLSEEADAIALRCREAFGLEEVDLRVSDSVPGPVTVGAVVLLPPAFLAESTPDELTSALGHEMAHIRRRDYALHLASEALLVLISFHPAVRRLRRRLAETREMACDEATVERLIGARAYARSLLSVAASVAGLPRPALTLGVHDPDTLEERMKRLTDPRSRLGRRLALASLSVALLVLAGTGLAASCLAVDAPSSEWSPFLGVWRSPGTDLEVRMSHGGPEAIVTLSGVDIPAYDLSLNGKTLTFHFRTAIRYREGARKEILEHTVELDLTGKDEATVNWLGSEHSVDSSQIPPPPPPQTARRVRSM